MRRLNGTKCLHLSGTKRLLHTRTKLHITPGQGFNPSTSHLSQEEGEDGKEEPNPSQKAVTYGDWSHTHGKRKLRVVIRARG